MLVRRAPAIAAVCGLAVALPAAGQSIPWLNPVNGNWSEAAKWTGGNVPDAPGEVGRLNVAGTYVVTQNLAGLTLSAINISTTTATLNLTGNSVTLTGANGLTNSGSVVSVGGNTVITGAVNNNASGVINVNANTTITLGGSVVNNGTITVNPAANGSFTTTLSAPGPISITGTGLLHLNSGSTTAQLIGAGPIENGADHLIHGRGQITAPLVNQGMVAADTSGQTLSMLSSAQTNNGTLLATGGGTLAINSIAVTQGASGLIEADGGTVALLSATINGGMLATANGGILGSTSGTVTLIDVEHIGTFSVFANTTTALGGSMFLNSGSVVVNPTANGSFTTTLHALVPMLITGPGEIFLNSGGTTAQITAAGGASITNDSDHMIHGRGLITAPIFNNGLLQSDVAGQTMTLNTSTKSNSGLMVATNTAIMAITGISIPQSPSAVLSADGGFVDLSSATISGGTIEAINGGKIRSVSATQTLDNVDLFGPLDINANTAVALEPGTFTNDGSVVINPTSNGSFTTTLRMNGAVAIDGVGEIALKSNGTTAQITNATGGSLTLGADQVVHGRGQITTPMINNGLVHANVNASALGLYTNAKANNAVMRASGNGILDINGIAINQSPSAEVQADGGFVDLTSATISGGTIEATNGGRVRSVSFTQTLDNVELIGPLDINANTAVALEPGTFTNNGSVVVNPTANGSFTTTLRMNGAVAIDGVGEIVLNSPGTTAQITESGGGSLTLGADQVVHGRGQITTPMVNNGLVHANVSPGAILLNSSPKTNNAVMLASGGSVLDINGITITQSPDAEIQADGGFVDLTSATISGGTIRATNGGKLRSVSSTQTLDNVELFGPLDINANTAVVLEAGTLTNNGSVVVNPTSNGSFTTTLRMNGAVAIGGVGEIVLKSNGTTAQITESGSGSAALGSGQTLRGIGNITAPITLSGTIAPGLSIGTLNVPSTGTVITYEPGSKLDVELGSASSYDRVTGGSHTINGGMVNVTLTGGYAPTLFTKHTIIDGSGASVVTGKFDGINGPALPPPLVWKIGYSAQDVVIGVTCPSDTNADFIVDILDFLDFFDEFASCENQPAPCGSLLNADYNGDTFVDILDFLDFLDAFGGGC